MGEGRGGRLVSCFGCNGSLKAVSRFFTKPSFARERKKEKRYDRGDKRGQTITFRTYGPCPTTFLVSWTPRH